MFDLLVVAGEVFFGQKVFGEMETGPGAPGAEGGMISRHAGGQVLEVADGISQEKVVAPMVEEPDQGRIGGGEIGDEGGLVELQNRLCRFFLLPERLGKFEAGLVKEITAFPTVLPGVRRSQIVRGRGEVGIEHAFDLRFPLARWPVTMRPKVDD